MNGAYGWINDAQLDEGLSQKGLTYNIKIDSQYKKDYAHSSTDYAYS